MSTERLPTRVLVTVGMPVIWWFRKDVPKRRWSATTTNYKWFGWTWARLDGGRSSWAWLTVRAFWYGVGL